MRRPFLFLVLSAVALLAAMNLLFAALAGRLEYHRKLEQIRTASDPQVVFVGNSLLWDFDPDSFSAAVSQTGLNTVALNTALSGLEPPEQWLLFHYAMQQHPGIHTLVVGFFDFQLTEPDYTRVSDLVLNRMVGLDPRFSVHQVVSAYNFGATQTLELRLTRALPILARHSNESMYAQILHDYLMHIGLPRPADPGDPYQVEAGSPRDFDRDVQMFLNDPTHFNRSFESIFREAKARHMQIVLVVMPMSPLHLHRFYDLPSWSQYLQALHALAQRRGLSVTWIDASHWLPSQSDFVDHVHTSAAGMNLFTAQLGKRLADGIPAALACDSSIDQPCTDDSAGAQ